MRHTYEVQNIRCGGCAATIKRRLGEAGFEVLEVLPERQQVTVEMADASRVAEGAAILAQLGYPPADAESRLADKARSVVSCAIGRVRG